MLIFPSFFFRKGKKRLSRDELEGHLELHVIRSLEESIAPSVEYKNDCWLKSKLLNQFLCVWSSPFVLLNLYHLETQFNPFDEIPIRSLLSNSTSTSSNFTVKHQLRSLQTSAWKRWRRGFNKRSNLLCILCAQTSTKESFLKFTPKIN